MHMIAQATYPDRALTIFPETFFDETFYEFIFRWIMFFDLFSQESAQVNLRQTIYRLRQAVPEVSSKVDTALVPLIFSDRQTVQLNPDADVRLDVARFTWLVEDDPLEAVGLYRGDFLADFYLPDSVAFEAWAERIREGLRRQVLGLLDKLAVENLEQGEFSSAQEYHIRFRFGSCRRSCTDR